MKRHKFNIFPEAKQEDYQRLRQDIEANGYDESQPIMLYQGDILDGWNRQKACDELGVSARYQHFDGDDEEAIAYMMRTNKRRNLNSGQWACISQEAEDLIKAIREQVEKDRRKKQAEQLKKTHAGVSDKKLSKTSDEHKEKTATKTAELFNTNRTYVNQAAKLKKEAPEVFKQVKAGTLRMTDAAKAVKAIPKDDWRPDERERQSLCKGGQAVVANASKDQNLIKWAESEGKAVRIDRGTKYGNPFLLDSDGDRDQVCDCYERHYLPHKPSITSDIGKLKGKVLVCHCHPLRCHGDTLAGKSNEAVK
jgi:hypothetical protein